MNLSAATTHVRPDAPDYWPDEASRDERFNAELTADEDLVTLRSAMPRLVKLIAGLQRFDVTDGSDLDFRDIGASAELIVELCGNLEAVGSVR